MARFPKPDAPHTNTKDIYLQYCQIDLGLLPVPPELAVKEENDDKGNIVMRTYHMLHGDDFIRYGQAVMLNNCGALGEQACYNMLYMIEKTKRECSNIMWEHNILANGVICGVRPGPSRHKLYISEDITTTLIPPVLTDDIISNVTDKWKLYKLFTSHMNMNIYKWIRSYMNVFVKDYKTMLSYTQQASVNINEYWDMCSHTLKYAIPTTRRQWLYAVYDTNPPEIDEKDSARKQIAKPRVNKGKAAPMKIGSKIITEDMSASELFDLAFMEYENNEKGKANMDNKTNTDSKDNKAAVSPDSNNVSHDGKDKKPSGGVIDEAEIVSEVEAYEKLLDNAFENKVFESDAFENEDDAKQPDEAPKQPVKRSPEPEDPFDFDSCFDLTKVKIDVRSETRADRLGRLNEYKKRIEEDFGSPYSSISNIYEEKLKGETIKFVSKTQKTPSNEEEEAEYKKLRAEYGLDRSGTVD